MIRLGLIGDHIAASSAPLLHRLAGGLCGLEVAYDLLVPREQGADFAALFGRCRDSGYRGINVTYPYKEAATALVVVDDPKVRALGAVNTVLFTPEGPKGFNTDHSGFIAACRRGLHGQKPGAVCVIGTGGVGRAVAFGLLALGAQSLRLVDQDPAKARELAEALRREAPDAGIAVFASAAAGVAGAAGIANCTPVGMIGHEGMPVPDDLLRGAAWAFDAVYTPVDTQFLQAAAAAGCRTISGYELFVFQGLHAFAIFCGREVDEEALRAALVAGKRAA